MAKEKVNEDVKNEEIKKDEIKNKEVKKEQKIYIYTGETIKKVGYVFSKGSFIEEKYVEEIKNKEEFKEDIKNFLTLDEYAARKGGN